MLAHSKSPNNIRSSHNPYEPFPVLDRYSFNLMNVNQGGNLLDRCVLADADHHFGHYGLDLYPYLADYISLGSNAQHFSLSVNHGCTTDFRQSRVHH